MQIKTTGLVLKHRNIGENDRIVTFLTADLGVVEVSARGVKSVRSPLSGAAQLLAYSELCLYKGRQSYYILNSAETVTSFYELRLDVEKLALDTKFCQLAGCLSPGAETAGEFLRLLLNTLHLLQEGKLPARQLKSIFELRALSVGGFMPNLVGCTLCGEYQKPRMAFLPLEGLLLCGDCFPGSAYDREGTILAALPEPVLAAMRHIVFSQPERLFSFRLAGESLNQLSSVTEEYTLLHTEGVFKALELFHQMELPGPGAPTPNANGESQ